MKHPVLATSFVFCILPTLILSSLTITTDFINNSHGGTGSIGPASGPTSATPGTSGSPASSTGAAPPSTTSVPASSQTVVSASASASGPPASVPAPSASTASATPGPSTSTPSSSAPAPSGSVATGTATAGSSVGGSGGVSPNPNQGTILVGQIATSGVNVVFDDLRIKAQLVAPLFQLGSQLAAPIVSFKATLDAPFVQGATTLARPLLQTGEQLAAPLIGLQQLAAANIAANPLVAHFQSAMQPITDATQPLRDALQPIRDAEKAGLGNLNGTGSSSIIALQGDVNQLRTDAGHFVLGISQLGSLSASVAAGAAASAATGATSTPSSRSRRDVHDVVPQVHDDKGSQGTSPPGMISEVHNVMDHRGQIVEVMVHNPNPIPDVSGSAAASSGGNGTGFQTAPPSDIGVSCQAFRSGLVTSECHRVEEYRTRTCSGQNCSALGIDDIYVQCLAKSPGLYCEQHCFNMDGENGETCFSCTFVFTRALSSDGKCAELNDCLFGGKICQGQKGQ